MATADVVVIGLGVTGSAALMTLAGRGLRAIGVEQFTPGHDRGSSHGETRIIRLGYFEHPSYVPLLRAAYPLWRDLAMKSGTRLLTVTGIVEIGAPESALVRGTLASSRLHALPHEVLDAPELMRRFPAFHVPPDYVGVWQPDGGFLAAEAAVAAELSLARAAGAELWTETRVTALTPVAGGVRIETVRGAIDAGAAVVAAGPWLAQVLPQLGVGTRVTRQVLAWFTPLEPALFDPAVFPVFLIETPLGTHYGFPRDPRGNVKIAKHHHMDEGVAPDGYDRTVGAADEEAIRTVVAACLPAANGPLAATTTCLYTMTPDGDFILDRLPGAPQIVVASPCSGHGFKFAPVVGEILADLATTGATAHDVARFRLDRFAAQQPDRGT